MRKRVFVQTPKEFCVHRSSLNLCADARGTRSLHNGDEGGRRFGRRQTDAATFHVGAHRNAHLSLRVGRQIVETSWQLGILQMRMPTVAWQLCVPMRRLAAVRSNAPPTLAFSMRADATAAFSCSAAELPFNVLLF